MRLRQETALESAAPRPGPLSESLSPGCSPGEAGVPQAEQEDAASGLVPGLPEAVHLGGADQGAGAPEAAQRPVPHQDPGQQQRVQVGMRRRLLWGCLCGFVMGVKRFVCFYTWLRLKVKN